MSKPAISAKDAVRDIRGGMSNAELMKKYGISETGLRSLLTKLVKAGVLKQSEADARLSPAARPQRLEPPPPPSPETEPPPRPTHSRESPAGRQAGDTRPCPFCSSPIDLAAVRCNHCGRWIEPDWKEYSDESDEYVPWEDLNRLGFFEAIKQTVTGVLFKPTEFFSQVPPQGGLTKPLIFGVILGGLGLVLGQIWTAILASGEGRGFANLVLWIVLSPIMAAIGLFVGSAITHVCLLIVGGANENYEATFRVQCYSQSAQIWQALPLVGSLVSGIWVLVAAVIGLREVHGTTTGQAVLAILLPILVCCGLGIMAAWFIGLAAIGTIMGGTR
ncbi:MAG: YIP1 family protein [Thermodesulfobacteriota bacterium]